MVQLPQIMFWYNADMRKVAGMATAVTAGQFAACTARVKMHQWARQMAHGGTGGVTAKRQNSGK